MRKKESDSVKFHILPFLSDVRISDEELIERINEATKVESERQEKQKKLTAGKIPIPYIGSTEVSFWLDSDPQRTSKLQVPILVSSDPAVASDPIIGYNVIEAIVNRNEGKIKDGRKQLAHK